METYRHIRTGETRTLTSAAEIARFFDNRSPFDWIRV